MTYTIKDNNGNMICSIENIDPVRSNNNVSLESINNESINIDKYSNDLFKTIEAFVFINDTRTMESFGYYATEGFGEKIKNIASKVWEKIKAFFRKIQQFILKIVSHIKNFFAKIKNKINRKKMNKNANVLLSSIKSSSNLNDVSKHVKTSLLESNKKIINEQISKDGPIVTFAERVFVVGNLTSDVKDVENVLNYIYSLGYKEDDIFEANSDNIDPYKDMQQMNYDPNNTLSKFAALMGHFSGYQVNGKKIPKSLYNELLKTMSAFNEEGKQDNIDKSIKIMLGSEELKNWINKSQYRINLFGSNDVLIGQAKPKVDLEKAYELLNTADVNNLNIIVQELNKIISSIPKNNEHREMSMDEISKASNIFINDIVRKDITLDYNKILLDLANYNKKFSEITNKFINVKDQNSVNKIYQAISTICKYISELVKYVKDEFLVYERFLNFVNNSIAKQNLDEMDKK